MSLNLHHVFHEGARKAEVYKHEYTKHWVVDCYVDLTRTRSRQFSTEQLAENYAEDFVQDNL
jgi:hypothetical protein